jgi:hypothetical protein
MRMQLDVRRIKDGEVLFRGPCGGSVNNALHIAHDQLGESHIYIYMYAC